MKGLNTQMQIQFLNQQDKMEVDLYEEDLRKILEGALAYANFEIEDREYLPSVNVVYFNHDSMKALNHETRQKDEITDVLSFPMLEMHEGKPVEAIEEAEFYPCDASEDSEAEEDDNEETYVLELGDIVIDVERALEQAQDLGHSLRREIAFLALHGMLHLLGYDHIKGMDEEQMSSIQEEILDAHGITREDLEDSSEALPEDFRSGFVSIIGRPNAGKSTLLNRLMGSELAITSRKAQTTRNNIRTVLDDGTMQIIFVDTPGIHRSKSKLDRFMSESAWRAMTESDLVLLLVDPSKNKITEVEEVACKKAREHNIPILLLLTKSDAMDKEKILPVIEKYSAHYPFAEIIPISAVSNDNIDLLLEKIRNFLPNGPRYYHQDAYTDQTERSLCAEFIREQVLHYTHQEIPHKAAVVIDKFEERQNEHGERSLVVIHASIITDKNSHKGMIIGKSGQMLKRIGQSARMKMEAMLDTKVYLDLHVKVRKDWQNKESILQELGYAKGGSGPSADDIL